MSGVCFNLEECYFTPPSLKCLGCRRVLLCFYENREGGRMQINILRTHQRHSILLNIFPLRRRCEHCRSSQQSRKSQTDSSIGNNGQNQRRLQRNTSYLVFVLLGASCVLLLYYHTFEPRDWLSESAASKSYSVQHDVRVAGRSHRLITCLSSKPSRNKK